MSGFDNEVVYANNVDFSGSTSPSAKVIEDGQLLIGSTVEPNIRVGKLQSSGGSLTISNTSGGINLEAGDSVPTTFVSDSGSATPASNILNVSGGTDITTSASGDTLTVSLSGTTQYYVQAGDASGGIQDLASLGTSGQVLTSNGNGALPSWQDAAGGGSGSTTAPGTVDMVDDFLTSIDDSKFGWGANTSGSPGSISASTTQLTSGRPGQLAFSAGGSTARANLYLTSGFILGGGLITHSWWAKTTALSDGTNTYTWVMGLSDNLTSATVANGVYFTYTDTVNSGAWVLNCTDASTTTSANSSDTLDTNWHKYTITVNAAASSVAFYVDDVECANSPITTNIPTTNDVSPRFGIFKSAGGATNSLYLDLFTLNQVLTTSR